MLKTITTLLLLKCFLFSQLLSALEYPSRDAKEFTARDALPNFFKKLEQGEAVTIVCFGGSITAQGGWRVQSLEWLQSKYPEATIHGINAGVGGTGSELGVFRFDQDALAHEPDLIFIEFAVNDSGASPDKPEKITKAFEGMIRKAWTADAETDICFVYTMTHRDSKQLAEGKMQRSVNAMEAIADHYGIPSVHMGYAAALMEQADELVMKTSAPMTHVSGDELDEAAQFARDEAGRIIFSKDGVHPYLETGHVLYTEALKRSLIKIDDQAEMAPHILPTPMLDGHWQTAQQVPIPDNAFKGPYSNLTAENDPMAKRIAHRMSPLYRLQPGASFQFKFKGTKAAIYDYIGPDSCMLEVTIDGESREIQRMDGYCTYHRVSTLYLADKLEDTVHEISIRVLDTKFDKSKVLFDRNLPRYEANKEDFEDYRWHLSSIFIVGELVE